ncbi:MAG: DNA-processing protein DprA [Candidatus Parcubacteria bacterium]|nr:DNA-processing protein DprA [Candidatus Parcubacteria bacterium]
MNQPNLFYWAAISAIPQVGSVRFKKIINYFSKIEDFFIANRQEILAAGIEEWVVDELIANRNGINKEAIWETVEQQGLKLITFLDPEYPPLLKEIYDWPPLLYVRGEMNWGDKPAVAIVGTRRHSPYGQQVAQELSAGLVRAGLVVVSGLAQGIDSEAHRAAVTAGGQTVAVLGTGLDWPAMTSRTKRELAEKIIDSGGAVITEFPCGMSGQPQNFPMRNRIISGLSLATIVVEAPEKSGALITARCALDQNREVFAVPGSIYNEHSYGCHKLIQDGARIITGVGDLLTALNIGNQEVVAPKVEINFENPEEAALWQLLSSEPVQIDYLITKSNLSSQTVNAVLALMEIKGWVRNLGGMRYVRGQ